MVDQGDVKMRPHPAAHFKTTKGILFNLEEGCFLPRKEAIFSIIRDKSRKCDWN